MTTKAKYSKSTDGIYPINVFSDFPDDAIEIPNDLYEQYQNGEVSGFDVVNGSVVVIELPPILPVVRTQFSSLDFLDRFTEQEQLAVVSATMVSAQVKLWYDRLLAASYVDLEDPRTAQGVDALIAAGLINANRKQAILEPA